MGFRHVQIFGPLHLKQYRRQECTPRLLINAAAHQRHRLHQAVLLAAHLVAGAGPRGAATGVAAISNVPATAIISSAKTSPSIFAAKPAVTNNASSDEPSTISGEAIGRKMIVFIAERPWKAVA